jgi:hypothetical protein
MSQKSDTRKVTSLSSSNPKNIYKYECNCEVCNGKEVDAKTQKKHTNDKDMWRSKNARKKQLARIEARKKGHRSKIINLKYNVEITTFVHINNTISDVNRVPDISKFLIRVTFYCLS